MRVFISYAREDAALAKGLSAALRAAGFDSFLDTQDLPPGQEYHARIKASIEGSDLFVFLASPESVEPGSYALTELAFAESRWRNPAGHVLPVVVRELDPAELPAYLRPINALQPRGNLEAEVVAWVEDRLAGGGGGFEESEEARLARWARLSQPPIRQVRRRLPASSIVQIVGGSAFVVANFVIQSMGSEGFGSVDPVFSLAHYFFYLVGCLVVAVGLLRLVQGLRGANPVASAVLDRQTDKHGVTVRLLTADGKRRQVEAVSRASRNVHPGQLGWAYVSGRLLLDFVPGSRPNRESG